jgi:hypothetical protein
MNLKCTLAEILLAPVLTSFVLLAFGCVSGTPQKTAEQKAPAGEQNSVPAQKLASTQNTADPRIDLNCIFDHIQNPTESFHYSYKHDGPNFVDEEADITPQTIDGSFKNNSFSRPVHGVHSDRNSWQSALASLMGIAGMSSTIALVKNSSSTIRESTGKVNGYDAIEYSVDTTRATDAEIGLYRSTLGTGGFEKGTVWVTSQGCPVKLSLDSEMHLNNGSVDKEHYEEEMVKK